MKINTSRPNIYLMVLSVFLLVFVLLFSFLVLIPEGKKYRAERKDVRLENAELRRYQNFNDEVLELLKKLQGDNRNIITAFDNSFDPQRFEKQHISYFKSLNISKKINTVEEDKFVVYEVNTTSKINSPKSFYEFLDAINKSDWIIGVNFPIHFKRDSSLIYSSFTMKVYNVNRDSNKDANNSNSVK